MTCRKTLLMFVTLPALMLIANFPPETIMAVQGPEINLGGLVFDEIHPGAFRSWNKVATNLPDSILNYYTDIALWIGFV